MTYDEGAYRRAVAARKEAEGECTRCTDRRAPGKSRCQRHVDEANRENREARHARIASGLCRLCKEPAAEGKNQCQRHLEMDRVDDRDRAPRGGYRIAQWTPKWLPVKRLKTKVETVVPVSSSWLVGNKECG